MSIITWQDVAGRYEEVQKYKDATQSASHYLPYAIGELESRLAPKFTVPFSSNNLTARDLAIDLVYLKVYRWKADPEKVERIEKHVADRIDALLAGKADMVLDDGTLATSIGGTIYSTTQGYDPVFSVLPIEDAVVDSAQLQAEWDARNG